jgi:hypothetical protein
MKIRNAAAAILGFAAVVLAALLVSTAFSDSDRARSSSAPGCRSSGWAATAVGQPSALSSTRGRSVFVWRDAKGWHLWTRGGSRSSALTAEIRANARLRVVRASRAMRSGLEARARSLRVRVVAPELARLDFASRCASRLNFRFGAAQPAPAATATPSSAASAAPARRSQGSPPRVFLGARGTAPALTFRLQRPATTGVAGRILLASNCPVGGPGQCPPPKPTQGTVRIETAPTGKGGGEEGRVVARVRSDEDGNYSAELAAGRYQLVVEKEGGYPVAKPTLAEVETGVVTQVDLYLDSGIR